MELFVHCLEIGCIQSRLFIPRFLVCQYEMLVLINQKMYYYYNPEWPGIRRMKHLM